jgi:hypothetical protein
MELCAEAAAARAGAGHPPASHRPAELRPFSKLHTPGAAHHARSHQESDHLPATIRRARAANRQAKTDSFKLKGPVC